jgi:hypothetical protein
MLAIDFTDPRPRDYRKDPKTRLERVQDRRDHVGVLKKRLAQLHERSSGVESMSVGRAYAKIAFCGVRRGEYHYGCETHGAWYQTITCKHALCPWCSKKRAARLLRIYAPHVTAFETKTGPRAVMVTLTQEGKKGERFRPGVDRLRKAHRKFTKILRDQVDGIGGVTTYEGAPRPDKSWHVHAHILLNNCTAPDDWTHPNANDNWRPLNPWRIRYAWALAHLDQRTRKGKDAAEALARAAFAGMLLWVKKLDHREILTVRGHAREEERAYLAEWHLACKEHGVPSVADVRSKHPSEALKYITKGYGAAAKKEESLTDWHLADLVQGCERLRRTDAWGALYHLQEATDDDDQEEPTDEEQADASKPCPCCGIDCAPILNWESEARPDWVLAAMAAQNGISKSSYSSSSSSSSSS